MICSFKRASILDRFRTANSTRNPEFTPNPEQQFKNSIGRRVENPSTMPLRAKQRCVGHHSSTCKPRCYVVDRWARGLLTNDVISGSTNTSAWLVVICVHSESSIIREGWLVTNNNRIRGILWIESSQHRDTLSTNDSSTNAHLHNNFRKSRKQ